MARVNKYTYLHVLQAYYSVHGWEDLTASQNRNDMKADMRSYQENQPGAYRIIHRRELNAGW